MHKYIVEFIGTFFLVFTVGMTVINVPRDVLVLAPVAIGSVLMVMIYAGGHISGGAFNPAVTIALWKRGRVALVDVPGYIAAQVLAAIVAAVIALYLKGNVEVTPMSLRLARR